MKNWRTTLVGALTGCMLLAKELVSLFDADPTTTWSFDSIIAALAAIGIGWFAKDAGVTGTEK